MEPKITVENTRLIRLKNRTCKLVQKEQKDQAAFFRNRVDYLSALEPFIETLCLSQDPKSFISQSSRRVIPTFCLQAPLELFHAAGLQPFKLACGSHVSANLAPLHLPALTCPMIKSLAGLLEMDSAVCECVIPTTCDWVVKFSELTGLHEKADIHFMELPHLRENERAAKRWLNEMKYFKTWLEKITGKKITPKDLHHSMHLYAKADKLYTQLIDLRRQQAVPDLHFAVIANALPYQDIEDWMTYTAAYILELREPAPKKVPVYLAGSPIVFPNYKMLALIENAGMAVTADDICTLERIFPGAAAYREKTEYALLSALALRNHTGCTCPTFADNQRRINIMTRTLEQNNISGVIFHVLKGCHPYDMEAGILENRIKEKGFRFLKIETDYVKEDEQNIVTRLEAFKRTLRSNEQ